MIESPVKKIAQPFVVEGKGQKGKKKAAKVIQINIDNLLKGHLILKQFKPILIKNFCIMYLIFKSIRSSRTKV